MAEKNIGLRAAPTPLDTLVKQFTPPSMGTEDIDRLAAIIRDAQQQPPDDPKTFVEWINKLLSHQRLRLRAGALGLASLAYREGKIMLSTRHGQYSFRHDIQIERVHEEYGRRRRWNAVAPEARGAVESPSEPPHPD